MTMETGSIIGTEDIGITTTTRMKETKERLIAATVAQNRAHSAFLAFGDAWPGRRQTSLCDRLRGFHCPGKKLRTCARQILEPSRIVYNSFGCAIIYSVGLLAGVTRMTDVFGASFFFLK